MAEAEKLGIVQVPLERSKEVIRRLGSVIGLPWFESEPEASFAQADDVTVLHHRRYSRAARREREFDSQGSERMIGMTEAEKKRDAALRGMVEDLVGPDHHKDEGHVDIVVALFEMGIDPKVHERITKSREDLDKSLRDVQPQTPPKRHYRSQ